MKTDKKVAIVFCVHHKPWLIMSTLLTVLAQGYKKYDIYFIYNQGDGTDFFHDAYKEYDSLRKACGANRQLSSYDGRVEHVCKISGVNIKELYFINDHGLDSGAWFKFIQQGLWEKYEYVFFLGEGALLTSDAVVNDTLSFMDDNRVHFITGSQEKRCIPRDSLLNINVTRAGANELDAYHDKMVQKVFDIFCRDKEFKYIFDKWGSDFNIITENHVPDIWGMNGTWQKMTGYVYPNKGNGRDPAMSLKAMRKAFFLYNQFISQASVFLGNGRMHKKLGAAVYVNGLRTHLEDTVKFTTRGRHSFHVDNDPKWFGCCCNHVFSRELLAKMSQRLKQHGIYESLKLPFCATALEAIWGIVPLWMGYDKWFFDGIHRVRKNFVNYRREDDQEGMVRYLNRYYSGRLSVSYKGDFIKLNCMAKDLKYLNNQLNECYF